ncbi:MAG: Gfo/Idh/MocA family oxidoreductase [Clostridia bacterium]|nr:Gfo/Idh/MocA family oxidoreductase [Clostridia bacterium]
MRKIRWGIVGPGNIANRFAAAVNNLDCAELSAVASRSEERARTFANEHGIPHVFCGYEAMAASGTVDAVYIATPHNLHQPCAEPFLNAGIHVLCEKPMCATAYQGRKLKECADNNGVFLMEAMWTRFLPAIAEAVKIVSRGDIGEVRGIKADFCGMVTEPVERLNKASLAGGSLLDIGVYCLHFAAIFLGSSPAEIIAVAHNDDEVDLHTGIFMKYESGAIADLTSAICVRKPEDAYIYGTKGYIHVPNFFGAEEIVVHTDGGEERIVREWLGNGFEEEIIECCKCIGEGKTQSDTLPVEESIRILEQMDKVRAQIGIIYPFETEL